LLNGIEVKRGLNCTGAEQNEGSVKKVDRDRAQLNASSVT